MRCATILPRSRLLREKAERVLGNPDMPEVNGGMQDFIHVYVFLGMFRFKLCRVVQKMGRKTATMEGGGCYNGHYIAMPFLILSLLVRIGIVIPGARHYLNHLPVINEAIGGDGDSGVRSPELEGSAGVLFQFEADPPTVTMQV